MARPGSCKTSVSGRLVGCARVSAEEQGTDPQRDELCAAGCTATLEEHASGADRSRPVLARRLQGIRPGDTLVVVRFDRLARSVGHLLAVIEQLEAGGAHFRSSHNPIGGAPLTCWHGAPRPVSAAKEVTVWANPAEPPLCPAVAFDAWLRHRT